MQFSAQFVSSQSHIAPVNMAETSDDRDWMIHRATTLAAVLANAGYGQFLIADENGEIVHSVTFGTRFFTA